MRSRDLNNSNLLVKNQAKAFKAKMPISGHSTETNMKYNAMQVIRRLYKSLSKISELTDVYT